MRTGINLMTDLIDSLLEFARTRESLNLAYSSVSETIQRALQAVRLHPRYSVRTIEVGCPNNLSGWFDQRNSSVRYTICCSTRVMPRPATTE